MATQHSLLHLTLSGFFKWDEWHELIAALPQLETLTLNAMTVDGDRLVEVLPPNLVELDIDRCGFNNRDLAHLAEFLKTNRTITTLRVTTGLIRDDGVRALAAALKDNTVLQTLDLHYNMIQCDGVVFLTRLPHIKRLYLSSNHIGERGVWNALANAKQYKVLELEHNGDLNDKLRENIVEEFLEKIPIPTRFAIGRETWDPNLFKRVLMLNPNVERFMVGHRSLLHYFKDELGLYAFVRAGPRGRVRRLLDRDGDNALLSRIATFLISEKSKACDPSWPEKYDFDEYVPPS